MWTSENAKWIGGGNDADKRDEEARHPGDLYMQGSFRKSELYIVYVNGRIS